MTIRYECSECGVGLKIKDELAGTKGKCPKCKTKFIVPDPETSTPTEDKSSDGAGSKQSMADWLAAEEQNSGGEYSADLPPVDEPDELTEDPTAALFDDFETPSVFVPDEPDPAEVKAESKKKRRERKSREKKKAPSAASTAGSAQALLNATAEKKRMQAGMPDVVDDDEGSYTVDAIKYYGTRLAIPAVGFLVSCYFIYSWLSSDSLDLPPLGQVSGVVTMDNQPVKGVYVIFEREFAPTEERFNATAGGVTNAQGEYEIVFSTAHNVYGAVIGPNIVRIQSEGEVFIPVRYNMATELKVTVESSNDPMDFPLTSAK